VPADDKKEMFETEIWTSQTSTQNQGSCQMGDENIQPQFSPRESPPMAQQSDVVPPLPISIEEFKSKSQYGEKFSFEDTHEEEIPTNDKDREKQSDLDSKKPDGRAS
jgi:hypothetical protein